MGLVPDIRFSLSFTHNRRAALEGSDLLTRLSLIRASKKALVDDCNLQELDSLQHLKWTLDDKIDADSFNAFNNIVQKRAEAKRREGSAASSAFLWGKMATYCFRGQHFNDEYSDQIWLRQVAFRQNQAEALLESRSCENACEASRYELSSLSNTRPEEVEEFATLSKLCGRLVRLDGIDRDIEMLGCAVNLLERLLLFDPDNSSIIRDINRVGRRIHMLSCND